MPSQHGGRHLTLHSSALAPAGMENFHLTLNLGPPFFFSFEDSVDV